MLCQEQVEKPEPITIKFGDDLEADDLIAELRIKKDIEEKRKMNEKKNEERRLKV